MSKNKLEDLKEQFDCIEIPDNLDLYIEKGIRQGKSRKRKKYVSIILPAACAASFVLVLALNNPFTGTMKKANNVAMNTQKAEDEITDSIEELPVVGSFSNLKVLIKDSMNLSVGIMKKEILEDTKLRAGDENTYAEASTYDGNTSMKLKQKNYSNTNTQVEGVDEGDIVKTDGEYIYKLTYNKLYVVKAYPSKDMKITDSILFKDDSVNLNPRDLILMNNKLVVIASSYFNLPLIQENTNSNKMLPYFHQQVTTIYVYDTNDKSNLKLLKKVQLSGNYTTTRRIDSILYITSNKYINSQIFDENNRNSEQLKEDLPYYMDSTTGNVKKVINYDSIKYCPDTVTPNYLILASIDLNNIEKEAKVTSILGNGYTVYTSEKNMYIAGHTKYDEKTQTTNTVIYKFSLNNGNVKFIKKGEVPGTLLNQFSLDEYDNYLRVATTTNRNTFNPVLLEKNVSETTKEKAEKESPTITNNIYILDKNMTVKGKIENIAPEERIYSVRYMGTRAYMVTFKNTDPLFVIDVKNPTKPKVLGELKIPGFSSYLHPYDENHLIGVGQDAEVIVEKGPDGKKIERTNIKGLKLSIYDVSNVEKPIEKFKTIIGDTGTNSELLYNHKAMLFSKDKNIFALPVSIYPQREIAENNSSEQLFQGAYVYNIDLVNGFKLKGKITHEDINNKGDRNMIYGDMGVSRILYINDSLYTISNGGIKSNLISNLLEQGHVKFDNK